MNLDLRETKVFLTGANGHLGIEIAKHLVTVGAQLRCIVRSESALRRVQRALPEFSQESFLIGDISEVQNITDYIQKEMTSGSTFALINNAMSSESKPIFEESLESSQQTMEYSYSYQILLAQNFAKLIINNQAKGSIVNVASMYGMMSPDPSAYTHFEQFHNPMTYGAAKAAIIQATKYLAVHLGKYGIRVNCISPGPFPGEEVQKTRDFIKELESRTALGRIGQPNEIAGPVSFLISDFASYITGHNLVVDGGWTVF